MYYYIYNNKFYIKIRKSTQDHNINTYIVVFLPGESQGWGSLVGYHL